MNVLITGASGFLGRRLSSYLDQKGLHLRCQVRDARAKSFLPGKAELCVIKDIGSDTDWTEAMTGIDAVIHLAARVHVTNETSADPLKEYMRVNVDGSRRLIEAAIRHKTAKFIFLSTIKVNGEDSGDGFFSETDPALPRDAYARSKWEAEKILTELSRDTNLKTFILRIPLVYGPGVRGNFLSLLKAVDRGYPVPSCFCTNRRSLLYSENLVSAVWSCLQNETLFHETFLVSDGEDLSTLDIMRMAAEAAGKPFKTFPLSGRLLRLLLALSGKKKESAKLLGSLCVNSRRIRSRLGWIPPYSVRQGISRTVAWFKQGDAACS